jgi:hypothetical protein
MKLFLGRFCYIKIQMAVLTAVAGFRDHPGAG